MHAQTVDTKWCGGSFHVISDEQPVWSVLPTATRLVTGMCFIVFNTLTVYILVIEVDIGPAGRYIRAMAGSRCACVSSTYT